MSNTGATVLKLKRPTDSTGDITFNLSISGTAQTSFGLGNGIGTGTNDYIVTPGAGVTGTWSNTFATITLASGFDIAELNFEVLTNNSFTANLTIVLTLDSTTPTTLLDPINKKSVVVLYAPDKNVLLKWIAPSSATGLTPEVGGIAEFSSGATLASAAAYLGAIGDWSNHIKRSGAPVNRTSINTLDLSTYLTLAGALDPNLITLIKYVTVCPPANVPATPQQRATLMVQNPNAIGNLTLLAQSSWTNGTWDMFWGTGASNINPTFAASQISIADTVTVGTVIDTIIEITPSLAFAKTRVFYNYALDAVPDSILSTGSVPDGSFTFNNRVNITNTLKIPTRFALENGTGIAAMSVVQGVPYDRSMFPITPNNLV